MKVKCIKAHPTLIKIKLPLLTLTITRLKFYKKTPFYKADNAPYKLYPYVVIQQGYDDVYRASLVYHVEGPNWVGRYLYHLPTTYPKAQFANTPPSEIKSLQQDLSAGTDELLSLLKRDDVGELAAHGKKAQIGQFIYL